MAAVAREDSDEDVMSFRKLGIHETLCEACDMQGWSKPTPIQEQSIPVALRGDDIIGLAETGSGKTGAFALPVLHQLLDDSSSKKGIFCLVLAPTRYCNQGCGHRNSAYYQLDYLRNTFFSTLPLRLCLDPIDNTNSNRWSLRFDMVDLRIGYVARTEKWLLREKKHFNPYTSNHRLSGAIRLWEFYISAY